MTHEHPSRRLDVAVATATVAVTLAVGVTLATWSGYLGPRPAGPAAATGVEAAAPEPAPAVILVPVRPVGGDAGPAVDDRLEAAFGPRLASATSLHRRHREHEDHEHDD